MNQEEKKLRAIVELAIIGGRIDELKRSKTYTSGSTYFRTRLTVLEDKAEKLQDIIKGRKSNAIKLVFEIPELELGNSREPEDIIQFMKKEFLVR